MGDTLNSQRSATTDKGGLLAKENKGQKKNKSKVVLVIL